MWRRKLPCLRSKKYPSAAALAIPPANHIAAVFHNGRRGFVTTTGIGRSRSWFAICSRSLDRSRIIDGTFLSSSARFDAALALSVNRFVSILRKRSLSDRYSPTKRDAPRAPPPHPLAP